MRIDSNFVKMTDALIAKIKELGIVVSNGNVWIAKPPVQEKTTGGIFIADQARELELKNAGFAKVIAIPSNLDIEGGDAPIKPGDYVFFTWVADSPLYYPAVAELTGTSIPKETLFTTQDSEIIAVIPQSQVENSKN